MFVLYLTDCTVYLTDWLTVWYTLPTVQYTWLYCIPDLTDCIYVCIKPDQLYCILDRLYGTWLSCILYCISDQLYGIPDGLYGILGWLYTCLYYTWSTVLYTRPTVLFTWSTVLYTWPTVLFTWPTVYIFVLYLTDCRVYLTVLYTRTQLTDCIPDWLTTKLIVY